MRAGRRQAFQLLISESAQLKGRLAEIRKIGEKEDIPVDVVPRARLEKINRHHQGVAVQVSDYPYSNLVDMLVLAEQRNETPLILLLDTLNDPQNLGSLLRTGEIVGIHGVLLPLRRTATITPAVVNASSGASEHLLITQINLAQAIKTIKGEGIWVIGLESGPESQLVGEIDLNGPVALVVGGEGQGMRSLVRKSCDQLLRLPMRGHIDSLNAAVAGSIALYLVWAARGYE